MIPKLLDSRTIILDSQYKVSPLQTLPRFGTMRSLLIASMLVSLSLSGILCTSLKSNSARSLMYSKKAGRPRASHPLDNVDYSKFEPLSELINNRPPKRNIDASSRYMHAFTNHPEVQAIDMTQGEATKLAQDLHSISTKKQ
jgi:hypothetical protein